MISPVKPNTLTIRSKPLNVSFSSWDPSYNCLLKQSTNRTAKTPHTDPETNKLPRLSGGGYDALISGFVRNDSDIWLLVAEFCPSLNQTSTLPKFHLTFFPLDEHAVKVIEYSPLTRLRLSNGNEIMLAAFDIALTANYNSG